MKRLLSKIPKEIEGKLIVREENCRICNEKNGKQIAVVDYWNIKTARLVKCLKCNHIQLDPMLNDNETSKGCFASGVTMNSPVTITAEPTFNLVISSKLSILSASKTI